MFFINQFASIQSKKFKTFTFSDSEEFFQFFESQGVKELESKEQGELIVFTELKAVNGGRRKENMGDTQVVVLDIDQTTDKEMEKVLDKLDLFDHILHETFSSTEDKPRLRVIMPLDQPVSGLIYSEEKLATRLATLLGIAEIDNASNNPVQSYYVPSAPIGEKRVLQVQHGRGPIGFAILMSVKSGKVKATKRSKTGATSELKGAELIAEAQRLIDEVFEGHIMFVNKRFWVYGEGIWQYVYHEEMLQHLLLDVYESQYDRGTVIMIITHLETITFQREFPTCKRKNGVVVLASKAVDPLTGKELKHNPRHYAKNKLNFDYDPSASCEKWLDFLAQVFRDDQDKDKKIMLLQEYTGLSLTPITRYQKMLWLIGAGSNGKGVIFDIIRDLIGSENCSALPLADFKQRFGLEQLEHKLANLDPEMSVSAVLADSKIKSVVGGDVISLERKMESKFQVRLFAKLWAAANSLPITRDTSHGFFRRVLILTFNRVFSEDEQDKNLTDELRKELPGIFNWSLEGLHRLLKNNQFTIPESAFQELDEYKANSNDVERFKREHLVEVDISANIRQQGTRQEEIYCHYADFCRANGMTPINSSKLGQQLKALGIIKRKSGNHHYYPVKVKAMDIYRTNNFMPRTSPREVDVDEAFNMV
jgi:putative DNA primase/helicase